LHRKKGPNTKTDRETRDTRQNQVFAIFVGAINQETVSKITAAASNAIAEGRTKIHLAMQSTGGKIQDGICLYNFFRTLPAATTLYNIGTCSSIAAVAFLGGRERMVSAYGTFMLHRTTGGVLSSTAGHLQAIAKSIVLDDNRVEAILRERLRLSEDKWRELASAELWLSARESLECGLVTAIGEFSPPPGSPILSW
jgi:ATP-dependent Clp protease, protease subunit